TGGKQVHRDHRELEAGAALEEQHVIALRDIRQFPEVRFAAGENLLEGFRPVADLEDRHADPGKSKQIALCLLEHFERENRGAGGKIENPGRRYHLTTSTKVLRPAG